jgi:hypothetical protein
MQGQRHALDSLHGQHRDAIFDTGVDAVGHLQFPRGPGRFKSVAKQVQTSTILTILTMHYTLHTMHYTPCRYRLANFRV